MSVIYIKMFTGEDIIATLTNETDDDIIITNPVTVKLRHAQEINKIMIGIYPWIPIQELMECEYNINKHNMIAITEVPPNVLYNYTRMITELQNDAKKSPPMNLFLDDDNENDDNGDAPFTISNTANRILH